MSLIVGLDTLVVAAGKNGVVTIDCSPWSVLMYKTVCVGVSDGTHHYSRMHLGYEAKRQLWSWRNPVTGTELEVNDITFAHYLAQAFLHISTELQTHTPDDDDT